ncbi:hypothetical protein DVU_2177 [Nitratidesulfovibrio vulgaris str. Hildenborough]|uniref:Uncharacterized protein n=1 Tax=Nitratidesulfovibrio vulgaris (strain ATCC 29579 / DSM 644 / CCUG 34227 / NCIMB 8303 / VKM B-1760 / Hildenborough) TaxID=882 RepID=Q72A20_NITV2|nr:hypothetical protein DVU_2177 [Nitratidesulfovibrio vulgaris str. Hildenborough]
MIPNGIAGKLRSSTILHEKCGEQLGHSIDAHFCKKFALLLALFNTKRDRESNPNATCSVEIDSFGSIDCSVKSGRLYVKGVKLDEMNKKIYCSPLSKNNLIKRYPDWCFVTELPFDECVVNSLLDFDDDSRLGLAKIAVEYALSLGLDASLLDAAFCVKQKKFLDVEVVPYYPRNKFERMIDETAWYFEKSRIAGRESVTVNAELPRHSLHLFSEGKLLCCYVSLFSYFDYYVVLSNSYVGNRISEWHIESVVKSTPYCSEYDLTSLDPKEVSICAQHWDMDVHDVWDKAQKAKQNDKKNVGILRKDIRTDYIKKEPAAYISSIADDLLYSINCIASCGGDYSKFVPIEVRNCIAKYVENESAMLEIMRGALWLLKDNIVDLNKYKTYFLSGGTEMLIVEYVRNNMDTISLDISEFRKNQLHSVIGSSEILYPTVDE